IGCGWGSLVVWAAERYGVLARGVTLSRAQAEYGQAWIRRLGPEERARVDHLDYRALPRELRFDKIAAVGVIEHLGIGNYPDYFARVHELLAPGGLFLNHGITHEKHWRRSSQTEFLERHVFPNGEMDNVSHILDVLERARFEIRDVESLREHYARTTRQWAERLQANAARARWRWSPPSTCAACASRSSARPGSSRGGRTSWSPTTRACSTSRSSARSSSGASPSTSPSGRWVVGSRASPTTSAAAATSSSTAAMRPAR